MSGSFLKTMERRAAELESQLEADPRYSELKALRVAIEAHKKSAKPATTSAPKRTPEVEVAWDLNGPGSERTFVRSYSITVPEPKVSRGKQAVKAAIDMLDAERRYMSSTELAEKLMARGVDLTSKTTPQAYLAAWLSGSDLVENIKGHGYGLTKWRETVAEKAQH
jgi:hypothetical protein